MMDYTLRLAPENCHAERVKNEFFTHMFLHRPADDATAANVEHDR